MRSRNIRWFAWGHSTNKCQSGIQACATGPRGRASCTPLPAPLPSHLLFFILQESWNKKAKHCCIWHQLRTRTSENSKFSLVCPCSRMIKNMLCVLILELQINWQMHKHRIMNKDQLNHVHKGQKYYIVLISTEKSFDNIQHAFW